MHTTEDGKLKGNRLKAIPVISALLQRDTISIIKQKKRLSLIQKLKSRLKFLTGKGN
jgi:hypothetical protein